MALSCHKSVEATLALIKPDIAANAWATKRITQLILDRGFIILGHLRKRLLKKEVQDFYAPHVGRFFHRRLLESTTSGPIVAMAIAKQNAISEWRGLIGETKVFRTRFTQPNTIRGELGLTDTRNSVHGSDSVESANREIQLLFPSLDIGKAVEACVNGPLHKTNQLNANNVLMNYTTSLKYQENFNKQLGLLNTWDTFYNSKEDSVVKDWFVEYEDMKYLLSNIIKEHSCVIDLGCGVSSVGPRIALDFPSTDVYCVDGVESCLRVLRRRFPCANMTCVVGNICEQLPFDTRSVDVVVDKGTYDSVLRQPSGQDMARHMLNEVLRVLKPGGCLVQITTDPPEVRLPDLQTEHTEVRYEEMLSVWNGLEIFSYIVTKL